ncbi:MAG: hypothetical protein ACJAR2_002723 [Ilumatobacter sp.]|jgi:hypothetical protein
MARPQIMCSGLGREDRIRVPSPAANTIAETLIVKHATRNEPKRTVDLRVAQPLGAIEQMKFPGEV